MQPSGFNRALLYLGQSTSEEAHGGSADEIRGGKKQPGRVGEGVDLNRFGDGVVPGARRCVGPAPRVPGGCVLVKQQQQSLTRESSHQQL